MKSFTRSAWGAGWATALVVEGRAVTGAAGALVRAPGTGTPSKKVLSHFCFPGPEQPATSAKARSSVTKAQQAGIGRVEEELELCDLFGRIRQPSARKTIFGNQIRKR